MNHTKAVDSERKRPADRSYVLYERSHYREIYLRRRRKGDPDVCIQAAKARNVPCGPPIAMALTVKTSRYTSHRSELRRAVCAAHLPGFAGTGATGTNARRAATERVLADHADLYERYLDEEIAKRVADITKQAKAKLDQLLGGGGAG
ncbi:hypothetical protein [Nonomuraea sp. CA-141351]|uniref:hypothetical protein n=1 Tax=Nonomuraea sp. CA-141351 TaxID=3239996 RepID=UPI003D94A26B